MSGGETMRSQQSRQYGVYNTGLFSHVEFPLVRIPRMFPKDGQSQTSHQKESHFISREGIQVLIKVWSDEDIWLAEEEWSHLKTAEESSVPESRLVEKELIRTNARRYIIMAIEFLEGDSIQQESVLDCATSVVVADMLHEKAGRLHYDFKPDNVVFSGQIAKLIDLATLNVRRMRLRMSRLKAVNPRRWVTGPSFSPFGCLLDRKDSTGHTSGDRDGTPSSEACCRNDV